MTKTKLKKFLKTNRCHKITITKCDDIKLHFSRGRYVLVCSGRDGLYYESSEDEKADSSALFKDLQLLAPIHIKQMIEKYS
jgi:hypothetical protein